jgi:hypothetical protein
MGQGFRRVERTVAMLRHVPARQVARRLELRLRERLAGFLPDATAGSLACTMAAAPPLPLFGPRRLLEPFGSGWLFHQPWGSCELPATIDWAPAIGTAQDASWLANLHYMEFLEGVDDAAFIGIVTDWIAKNPVDAENAWRFSWRQYNLSIRVVVWMQQLAVRRSRLPERFVTETTGSLIAQLRFLERHLETDIHGNHLIRNIKALIWAGAFFDGPQAAHWRRRGEGLLAGELPRQILRDGWHYELSPSYHCQVFGDLIEIASVLQAGALREALLAALDRMVVALVGATHPDGTIALFNDGGIGLAYQPSQLLDVHAVLRERRVTIEDGVLAFPEAGFYTLRAGDGYLVVDCGPIGPDELIGHGHGDILTFEWSAGGRRIVVDQGTYQYAASSRRIQSRATANHNTVSIGGADMCDFFDAHRCGRRARPTVLDYRPTATGFLLEGTHDGFAHLPGRPRPVRCFDARPEQLTIHDRLEGGTHQAAEGGLLLHPDCRVTLDEDGATVTADAVVARIDSHCRLTAEPAEWFPNLYVSQPTTRLRYTVTTEAGANLVLRRLR